MMDLLHMCRTSANRTRSFATTFLILAATLCSAQSNQVNIYNWSEYIGETTLADFTKETGVAVRYDTFDSNETVHAKMVAGRTGYDIIIPGANWGKIQLEGGLLQKLDKSRIANYKNLDPFVMKQLAKLDPGNQYLLPYLWGITTVGINVDKVKKALGNLPMPDNSWELLFNPTYVSKLKSCGVSVLDSADEVFPAALHYLGKDPFSKNPADYKDAAALLNSIRPNITLFSSSGYINDLASGSLCVSLGWNGDIGIAAQRAKEAKNGQAIQIMVPKTGAVMFFDGMSIPTDAPNVANAYKWINFLLKPETQAGIVNHVKYANAVRAADPMIKEEVRDNRALFLQGDELANMVPFNTVSNDVRRLRGRLYTTFKTGL